MQISKDVLSRHRLSVFNTLIISSFFCCTARFTDFILLLHEWTGCRGHLSNERQNTFHLYPRQFLYGQTFLLVTPSTFFVISKATIDPLPFSAVTFILSFIFYSVFKSFEYHIVLTCNYSIYVN